MGLDNVEIERVSSSTDIKIALTLSLFFSHSELTYQKVLAFLTPGFVVVRLVVKRMDRTDTKITCIIRESVVWHPYILSGSTFLIKLHAIYNVFITITYVDPLPSPKSA